MMRRGDARLAVDCLPTMCWPEMSVGEYVAFQRAVSGLSAIQVGGVWWRQVRPLFYRPVDLLATYPEDQSTPGLPRLLGAVQYPVASETSPRASTRIRLIVDDAPAEYSIDRFRSADRNKIRRGLSRLTIQPIRSAEELATQGHAIYVSFYQRTRYRFDRERTDARRFADWARKVFSFPKVRLLGAYHSGQLVAVSITYRVVGTVYYATFFGNDVARENRAAETVLHSVRSDAAAEPGVRCLFGAVAGMPRGLDSFYLERGFRCWERPAIVRGNAVVLTGLRFLAPGWYRRIAGIASPAMDGASVNPARDSNPTPEPAARE